MGRRALIFVEFDGGCYVPLSHGLNQDGYFRKSWGHTWEMFHRFIWRAHHGDIPKGHEVDHVCRNKACCNIKHLQILSRSAHAIKSNKERYKGNREIAYRFWKRSPDVTGTALAEMFGVSFGTGCEWIRYWKKQQK